MKKLYRLFIFVFFYVSMIAFIGCNKDLEIPSVSTYVASNVTATSATSGGVVSFIGTPASIQCGICWSTVHNPTVADIKTVEDITSGSSFSSLLNHLTPNTTYFVRAYITYIGGTNYGNEISFTTNPAPPMLLAKLETTAVSGISAGYAVSGGSIISDGGANLTEKGICWGTKENPTTDDYKRTASLWQRTFSIWIDGLRPSTKYYLRSYAINSAGTSYGNELNFTTLPVGPIIFNPDLTYGTISDIDGNIYKTIQIGNQFWMAENLRTTRFNDGTSIPNITDYSEWRILTTPGYSWYNNDAESYKTTYGALYNWYAVSTGHLCPAGWHVPDEIEFKALIINSSGEKLVEKGNSHWLTYNSDVTNESGFTALPSGARYIYEGNPFVNTNIGYIASLWSATGQGASGSTFNLWWEEYINAEVFSEIKGSGLAVRCIKDN